MRQKQVVRWLVVVGMLMALVLVAMPAAAQESGDFTLNVVHTNDTHAHIEQSDSSGNSCSEA
nr:hypothetical protein [Caldilineaceae bacterium]